MTRRLILALLVGWTTSFLFVAHVFPAAAASNIVNKDRDNVAILGYDAVAYFTESRAVKGNPEFEYSWNEARWQFSKAEYRDRFARDPEAYAPRFGGFCTGGMSLNYIQEPNPENWAIIDGRLYLNHSKAGLDRLRNNAAVVIGAAEANWVVLSQKYDPAMRRPCKTCAASK